MCNDNCSSVKMFNFHWSWKDCLFKCNLMDINQVLSLPVKVLMRNLVKFYNKVACKMAIAVISFLFKLQIGLLREPRLDLDLNLLSLSFRSLAIMLEHLSFIFKFFNASIVKFIESTVQFNDNVLRRRDFGLVLSTKCISKQTSILIWAIVF